MLERMGNYTKEANYRLQKGTPNQARTREAKTRQKTTHKTERRNPHPCPQTTKKEAKKKKPKKTTAATKKKRKTQHLKKPQNTTMQGQTISSAIKQPPTPRKNHKKQP